MRSRIGPLKSTSISMAKEPNAENVATAGSRMTKKANPNSSGMTTAVRVEGRVVAPELDDLGAAVVGSYLGSRGGGGDGSMPYRGGYGDWFGGRGFWVGD